MSKTALGKKITCCDILAQHIGIKLVHSQYGGCIIAQQRQSLARIALTAICTIDNNTHLGTMVGWIIIEEVDNSYHPTLPMLYH